MIAIACHRHGAWIHRLFAMVMVLLTLTAHAQQTTTYSYQYDANGNLTQVTDPLGHTTRHRYDALDRRTSTTDAGGGTTTYAYDARDHLIAVTDPRNLTTTYTYDGLGRLTRLSSPDTGTTTYTHDAAGNVLTRTDARGQTTTYAYDVLNRLTLVTHADGTTIAYGYDQGQYAIGRLSSLTDDSGHTSYTYDIHGRVTGTVSTIGSGTAARSYGLAMRYGTSGSSTGKRISLTYPSGNRIDTAYDAAGHVTSLTLYAATDRATAVPLITNIGHAPFGAAQTWVWGNSSATAAHTYARGSDLDGRRTTYPLGHPLSDGSQRSIGYDAASRIVAMTHGALTALDRTYDYDALDRLTGASSATASWAYQYDANGNRTRFTVNGVPYANTIAATSNRLTATTGPAPAKSNTYDAAGNPVQDGTVAYDYAASGRLRSVTVGGGTVTYRYNGLGQRVRKSGPTTLIASREVDYVYDEAGRLLGEYDTNGKPLQETVYLGDMPVAVLKQVSTGTGTRKVQSTTTQVYYVYADHLDTPRVITRATDNQMVWRWDQGEAFGMTPPDENPSGLGTFTYNLRFTGQVYDRETNLHYNANRDYDPQTGRYIQSDPIGLAGGSFSTYAYANLNPLTFIDPSGESAVGVGACVIVATSVYFVYKYNKFVKCVKECSQCPNNPMGDPNIICQPPKNDGNTNPETSCRTYCTLDAFGGPRGKGKMGSDDLP